jgi:hypothetical protein
MRKFATMGIVVLIIATAGCIAPDETPKGRALDYRTTTVTEFRTRTTPIFRGESTEAITQLIQPGSMKPAMESMADRVYEVTHSFYFFKDQKSFKH